MLFANKHRVFAAAPSPPDNAWREQYRRCSDISVADFPCLCRAGDARRVGNGRIFYGNQVLTTSQLLASEPQAVPLVGIPVLSGKPMNTLLQDEM